MAIPTNPVSIGGSTRKSDYDTLYDNAILADTGGAAGGAQTVSGVKTWSDGQKHGVRSIGSGTSTVTVLDDDEDYWYVTCGTNTTTVTLPTAGDNTGRQIIFNKVDDGSGPLSLDGEGAEEINGTTTRWMQHQFARMAIRSNGSAWIIDDGEFQRVTYDIPSWNMDTGASTNVSHTLSDAFRVRDIEVVIRNDGDTLFYTFPYNSSSTVEGAFVAAGGSKNITVQRATNGRFDGVQFDSVGQKRGWVTLTYTTSIDDT